MVGLEVEAGSAAAVEVTANGHAAVTKFGVARSPPGSSGMGRSQIPMRSGRRQGVVRAQQAVEERAPRSREPACGGATLQLPAIEDHKELKTAISSKRRTRFRCLSTKPSSTGRWSDIPRRKRRADDRRGRRCGAPRCCDGIVSAMSQAGLRPVGIDLAAFGMIRALSTTAPGSRPRDLRRRTRAERGTGRKHWGAKAMLTGVPTARSAPACTATSAT